MSDYTLTAAEAEAIDRDLTMTATDLYGVSATLQEALTLLVLAGSTAEEADRHLEGLRRVADGATVLKDYAARLRAMATTPEDV